MKVFMKTRKQPRLADYVLAVALVTSIVTLVLTFFAFLPSIAEIREVSADRTVLLEVAEKMALEGSLATAISAGVMVFCFILLKLILRKNN